MTDDQACFYAGITVGQLKYFQSLHPDFFTIKHACKQKPLVSARLLLFERAKNDPSIAQWLLERLEKEVFSTRVEQTGADGRDLYDGLTEKLNQLTSDIENEFRDTDKEHSTRPSAGDSNARQDGVGDDTATSESTGEKA